MEEKHRKYKAVTLDDVARAADVSAITVSRALRTPEIVSTKVLERVQAAVHDLGYTPNPAARALASAKTTTIGVIIPSVTNSVFSDVLRGIYDGVEGTAFQVQLGNTRYMGSKEEELLKLFAAQRPSGLIVSGTDQSERSRKLLESFGCPIVQIMEFGPDPVDMMVGTDHRLSARAAVRHLVEKGYRRIGFLGARMDPRAQRRLQGYSDVLHSEGLFQDRLILTTPRASSVTVGSEMFADFLGLAPDVDAVFCNNDDIALGVLFECQRRRIKVPEQFGIVGFNDLDMVAASMPSITSVRTHRYEMGKMAIEMVISAAQGSRPEQPVVDIGYELKVRQSTDRG
ncbi:LacI family DNA-binding transcriptional regulator [Pelagibacterium lentulum]|uniref:LacI family transcriptional regulator n=1 Tax=Pelagibacterium lentulum TaxID=2029865 RepID=A0A916W2M8_9HYPH|nr:LacI family DNA-binding transcriptional regulator [Pelagibacterium lentulum]GGA61294.1 LacI family transcriptional regulator [Pelagibacterium lentulum]